METVLTSGDMFAPVKEYIPHPVKEITDNSTAK